MTQAILAGIILVGRLGVERDNFPPRTVSRPPAPERPGASIEPRRGQNIAHQNSQHITTRTSPRTPTIGPRYVIFSWDVHITLPYPALKLFRTRGSVVGVGVDFLVLNTIPLETSSGKPSEDVSEHPLGK